MAPSTEGGRVSGESSAADTDARGLTARQRRNVRLTTWVVTLIALTFYIGFIVLNVTRAHH